MGCGPIAGATSKSYTLQKDDVDHTLSVHVTAKNADGSTTNDSKGTGVVADKVAPKLKTRPSAHGHGRCRVRPATTNGTWAGATRSITSGSSATRTATAAPTSPVRPARSTPCAPPTSTTSFRARVTATNKYGATRAYTGFSSVVTAGTPSTTTTVVTTTVAGNRAPTLKFISLKVRSNRVYVRFRVCDDSSKVTVVERDQMKRRLAYTRKFAVHPAGCGTYSRNWVLIPRFRAHGKFVVTLRAVDKSQRLSKLTTRSVFR